MKLRSLTDFILQLTLSMTVVAAYILVMVVLPIQFINKGIWVSAFMNILAAVVMSALLTRIRKRFKDSPID